MDSGIPEDPHCYACGGPISTADSTPWNIRVSFRDALDNLVTYSFVVADDSNMAIGYLNGMYHRSFFARAEPSGSYMQVIPVSRIVEIVVSPVGTQLNA